MPIIESAERTRGEYINPNKTFYNGFEYDSGLEAKYAMAFDRLGIGFVNQPCVFRDNGLKFRPDFKLVDLDAFFEVKGVRYTEVEQRKFQMVARNHQELIIGDNNGFLYFAEEWGLREAKIVQCLNCLQWGFKPGICRSGCQGARIELRDNIFDVVGERVYERERNWPLGHYPDLDDGNEAW